MYVVLVVLFSGGDGSVSGGDYWLVAERRQLELLISDEDSDRDDGNEWLRWWLCLRNVIANKKGRTIIRMN